MPSECDNCHIAAALRLHASVFEHSGEAILVTDAANRIIAANPELTRLTGYPTEELLGRDPKILSSGETPPETYRAMWDALRAQGRWQGELRDRRKDGGVYPKWVRITALQDAGGAGYIASFTDISKRKSDEARLSHLAFNDSLTGLLNRHGLKIQLDRAMTAGADASRRPLAAPLAILLLGLHHLKSINKTLGHAVGDQLLAGVAERLSACAPDTSILATLGGGEFVIGLPAPTEPQARGAAHALADKILGALGDFQISDGRRVHADASIGISVFPADGADAATLLQHAAAAMYAAKENKRANIQFFDAAMNLRALARLELETDLRDALKAGQLELHYQPQITASDGRICGFEALLRWRHPRRGMVSPADFIPIAEASGLIEPIGAWVLDSACRQLADWRAEGIAGLRMAVNLSARELRSSDLVERVRTVLDRHGIQASQIEIEVTESVAMDDPERGIELLRQLHALGVTLAIDDFGTGYSSLAYLKLLPIHVLKIDRAFVRDVETDANDAAICAATIALAHTLGLKVVAEGIETEAQRHVLATVQGCDYLQGYFFGRPAPAASWRERLLDTKSPAAGISSTPFSTDKDAT